MLATCSNVQLHTAQQDERTKIQIKPVLHNTQQTEYHPEQTCVHAATINRLVGQNLYEVDMRFSRGEGQADCHPSPNPWYSSPKKARDGRPALPEITFTANKPPEFAPKPMKTDAYQQPHQIVSIFVGGSLRTEEGFGGIIPVPFLVHVTQGSPGRVSEVFHPVAQGLVVNVRRFQYRRQNREHPVPWPLSRPSLLFSLSLDNQDVYRIVQQQCSCSNLCTNFLGSAPNFLPHNPLLSPGPKDLAKPVVPRRS